MNIAGLLQTIGTFFWVVVIAVAALVVTRSSRGTPIRNGGLMIVGVIVIAVILTAAGAGIVFINPEERGVVISALSPTGYRADILQPGLRWVIPFFEHTVTYPISRQSYTMSAAATEGQVQGDDSIAARTADGQQIYVDASVIYSLDPTKLIQVHINWQNTYSEGLIRPIIRGIIRDVVSQYGVQEVNSTRRAELTEDVRKILEQKLADNGLVLQDFILRNIAFSPEYGASIEQKQIAEQQAQQAKFVVESKKQEAEQARQIAQGQADAVVIRAKGEAESRVISAQAEAEANKAIAESLRNNPELLTYQYIQKLSSNIQVMLLPSNNPFLMNLPALNGGATTIEVPTQSPTPVPTTVPTPVPTPAPKLP